MLARLWYERGSSLPRYSFWRVRGHDWGGAVYSILHRQPIQSFSIPMRAHRILNMWGPNGWMGNSRFNIGKPYNPSALSRWQAIAAAVRSKFGARR